MSRPPKRRYIWTVYVALLVLPQILFFTFFQPQHAVQKGTFLVLVTLLHLLLYLLFIIAILPHVQPLFAIGTASLITCYLLLLIYHWKSGAAPTFLLLKDHAHEIFRPEAAVIVMESLEIKTLLGLMSLQAALVFVEIRYRFLLNSLPKIMRAYSFRCFIVIAYLGSFFSTIGTHEENHILFGALLRTQSLLSKASPVFDAFPYIRNADARTNEGFHSPHIFLIVLESLNAGMLGRQANARAITPTLDELKKKSVSPPIFYGNSTYSIKGYEAILSGIPPTIVGSLSTDYEKTSILALPAILRKYGYLTAFYQAYADLTFGNVGSFMQRAGFEHIETFKRGGKIPDDEYWGWGLQDTSFYAVAMESLEALSDGVDDPVFVMLVPASNHAPFDAPTHLRYVHSEPTTKRERYENTLAYSDEALKDVLQRIQRSRFGKDALIIIVGDHSYPMGEHEVFAPEASFYEETFRTACFLLWESVPIPPLGGHVFSQIDLAPTILDLLNIGHPHHFVGRSMFERHSKAAVNFLVQPYGGCFLAAVEYPFKYVHDVRTGEELLFNLLSDPEERQNVGGSEPLVFRRLKSHLDQLILNQRIVSENRVWNGNIMVR